VRFDVAFRALAPEMALIAPIRELAPSRAEERAYLAARGFEFPEKLESYSINEGMWGTSVGGKETLDPWQHLPAAAYPGGEVDPMRPPQTLEISFARGVPCALDGKSMAPVALVQALNEMGLPFGIGRGIHLGDTIMGIKGRVGFEAPAAHILIAAHRELEKLVLTGKQTFWKESLGNLYGSMLHEGHFFDPLCRDLEAFLDSSQTTVTGDVRLQLHPLGFHVEGVRSLYALVRPEMASYGESTRLWSGPEAAGFAKIFGVPQMVALKARPEQP
jgi:argininosuccinate synthase